MSNNRYGWIPDRPDHRDHLMSMPRAGAVPNSVDLRDMCPPVYDQGQLGSCTANAIAAALEYEMLRQGRESFTPSRLFIYYNERAMEGTVESDSGAMIRDGIKSVAELGVCPERDWDYNIPQFTSKPPAECYSSATGALAVKYGRVVQTESQMLLCLAAGFPFVFGFTVYESFESESVASSGVASMPLPGEAALGGHAVMAVGYDLTSRMFLVRNSWGTGWGKEGYFAMPFQYLIDPNLADDFWNIQLTS